VAGFERAGIFSPGQSHGFPLSSAICCRPCFGTGPNASAEAAGLSVAAVVSTSCAQSRWDNGGQECPDDSFIAGYASGVLGNPINRFYPVDQATCCRPALLLTNGSTRMLRRCSGAGGCFEAITGSGVSCAAEDTPAALRASGRLVHGWASVLREPGSTIGLSSRIPTAPARCCAVCLDPAEPAVSRPCDTLNFCSGHGSCGLGGQCTCDSGWGGLNCGEPGPPSMLQTVTSAPLIVLAGLFVFLCIAGLAARSATLAASLSSTRRAAAAAAAARRTELEAPLLNSSDTEGESEWGSDDGSEDSLASDAPVEPEDEAGPAEAVVASECSAEAEPAGEAQEAPAADAVAADAVLAAPRKGHGRLAPDCNGALHQVLPRCRAPLTSSLLSVHGCEGADCVPPLRSRLRMQGMRSPRAQMPNLSGSDRAPPEAVPFQRRIGLCKLDCCRSARLLMTGR